MTNEFLLQDRLQKIQSVVGKYGEENFYLSFSGGKDSTALHNLLDMALPHNRIPRVYANTGIEYRLVFDFVRRLQETDDRIIIIKPRTPIKPMLEACGYPFKSKQHSATWESWNRNHNSLWARKYVNHEYNFSSNRCPKILKYQFDPSYDGPKMSDKCCLNLKEKPLADWQKENNRPFGIVGIMPDEGGRRQSAKCMAFQSGKLKNFQPLVAVTKEWEEWFIEKYDVKICDIYYPPYSFDRTGWTNVMPSINSVNTRKSGVA